MVSKEIKSHEDYSLQLGYLISEMIAVRNETFRLTQGLSIQSLDYNFDDQSNSIGTLLLHIAALELKFQLNYFFDRPFSEQEIIKFGGAFPFNMDKRCIDSNPLQYYVDTLKEVRNTTLTEIKKRDDNWLEEKVFVSNQQLLVNHHYELKHIIHDELCHQGQIKLILKRLPK
ncbi:mycothiol transferase [Kordia zhangzhouensis]|uniref:mycothiol transferase n=1 Tax=Kordia zhangzhouensis TaxID=1620405 RepID=UPI000629C38C|nr:DUF664 domain-containing protein [Kordia zhangzhouensis]